jgi:hypothetical protein
MPDLPRLRLVGGVVDLDASLEISGALAGGGAEQLVVDQHDVAVHPHLVRVGVRRQRDLRYDLRPARVGHVDDRGAVRRPHVADIDMVALGDDLAATGYVELGEMVQQRGHAMFPVRL